MSGMSIDGGASLDVQTVLNGGPEFLKRLEQWQAAKDAHDAAFERLKIGENAVAYRDEASRLVESAKEQAKAIETQALSDATTKQRSLNEFIAAAQAETSRAMESAQAKEREADRKLAAADETHQAAAKALSEASELLAKHRSAVDAVAKAQQALAAAT